MSASKFLVPLLAAVISASSVPSLATVRDTLALFEDSIIASLISRAKLPVFNEWYSQNGDFIEYLHGFEQDAASIGRYDLWSGEVPFTLEYPLHDTPFGANETRSLPSIPAAGFSINDVVYRQYMDIVIPGIASFNSTAVALANSTSLASAVIADHALLSLISKRIHYGKVVAEAKFVSNPTVFVNITDVSKIQALLTDKAQESVVKTRTTAKAKYLNAQLNFNTTSGALINASRGALDSEWIGQQLYGAMLIPTTTEVEVQYILSRNKF